MESFVEQSYHSVVHRHLGEPRTGLFQTGTDLFAQMQNRGKVLRSNCVRINPRSELERVGQCSVCHSDPDRPPLRNSQLGQRKDGEQENEDRHHGE